MERADAVAREPRIRVVDAYPDLGKNLDPEQSRLVRHHALARLEVLKPGRWIPRAELMGGSGHLGLLVLDGLLTRDVMLGDTIATELVGRGDLLRPGDYDGATAPVPFDVAWSVLEPTRLAVLDRQFAEVIGRFPDAFEVLVSAAVRRALSLAIHLAVCHLRRVDTRLLVLMWHLADRWGSVRPEGISIPLKLTHQTLGRLVGAQRPSVTTALRQLADDGRLTRTSDGGWLLHGEPPDTLQRIRADARRAVGE
jgi:CRP-like cAMP-binding protein